MSQSHSPSNLRIGIVGAGYIGEPLARLFTLAGHSVKIANSRGPETLPEVAQRTGATAATVEDAVKDANLIVVTIPQKNVPQLGDKKLFNQLPADTIVIDTGNCTTITVNCLDQAWTKPFHLLPQLTPSLCGCLACVLYCR